MKSVGYRTASFVILSILVLFSSALGEGDSTLFYCLTPDSLLPPIDTTWPDTLSPVVIYACHEDASQKFLPSWYDDIWIPANAHSVPLHFEVDFV